VKLCSEINDVHGDLLLDCTEVENDVACLSDVPVLVLSVTIPLVTSGTAVCSLPVFLYKNMRTDFRFSFHKCVQIYNNFPSFTILALEYSSFFLNRPLLPCGVEGFLLVNLLDNW
jgi:hypothetical protein